MANIVCECQRPYTQRCRTSAGIQHMRSPGPLPCLPCSIRVIGYGWSRRDEFMSWLTRGTVSTSPDSSCQGPLPDGGIEAFHDAELVQSTREEYLCVTANPPSSIIPVSLSIV